jgi:hypothetical protein
MNQAMEDKNTMRRLATAVLLMSIGALGLVALALFVSKLH